MTQIAEPHSPRQPHSRRQPNSPRPRRSRTDRATTAWMFLAAVAALVTMLSRGAIPQSWWVTIHLVTLGVLTNAILQWSWFFARSLLRLSPLNRHGGRDHLVRQVAFNVALIGLIAAMMVASLWGAVASATAIGVVLAWNGFALFLASKQKLASRFAIVIRYYIAAAGFFVLACALAGLVVGTMFAVQIPEWLVAMRSSLTLAHSLLGALGWIGLTILGTLVTLWPTILHTRITQGAASQANLALPFLVVGLLVSGTGAVLSQMWLAGLGLLVYAVGACWGIAVPLLQEAKARIPADVAGWSVAAGMAWASVGLVWLAVQVATAPSPDSFREDSFTPIAIIGVGGVLQIFVGALTYLMPVVIGGGRTPVRAGIATLNQLGTLRLTLRNSALALALVAPAWPPAFWALVLVTYIWDFFVFARAGIVQARAKKSPDLAREATNG